MNVSTALGVTVTGSAYGLAYVDGAPNVIPAIALMTTRHIAPAAHAAWAVDAIAPQRKRRTAAATDASVDRGLL